MEPTTSPVHHQLSVGAPSASSSCTTCAVRHSKLTGASATRGAATSSDSTASSPARSNSSTPARVEVAFICSASARVTRFQVKTPVSWALRTLSLSPMLLNPTSGGV